MFFIENIQIISSYLKSKIVKTIEVNRIEVKRMSKNSVLDQLKYEVSKELGYINSGSKEYEKFLNNAKFEVADELGIQLNYGYNGDITSRDAGRIGGHIGGKIGGNMVKKMLAYAEDHIKNSGGSSL